MNKQRVLTVDREATKRKLRADGRTVAAYGRARGFIESTSAAILGGRFPRNDKLDSVYQRFLQSLEKDGYLVEAEQEHQEHKAAV